MQTYNFPIRFDTPGILSGVVLYQPHKGERLMSALSYIHVTEPWNGTAPELYIYASKDGSLYNAVFGNNIPLIDIDNQPNLIEQGQEWPMFMAGEPTLDGSISTVSQLFREDAVWNNMTHPLRVILKQRQLADPDAEPGPPGCTRGAVQISLTFATPGSGPGFPS